MRRSKATRCVVKRSSGEAKRGGGQRRRGEARRLVGGILARMYTPAINRRIESSAHVRGVRLCSFF